MLSHYFSPYGRASDSCKIQVLINSFEYLDIILGREKNGKRGKKALHLEEKRRIQKL
jgi:hypothetical protein